MKRSAISTPMRILSLLYLISATLAFGMNDDLRRPPLEQCIIITLRSPCSWTVDILPDGSGRIGYGALSSDHVSFPKKTFDFDLVYKELIQTPGEAVSGARSMCLFFLRKNTAGASSIQNSNIESCMKFFQKARESAPEFEKTRLPKIWAKHSPRDLDH